MTDASWLIVVLNNIGNQPCLSDLLLSMENTFLVILRRQHIFGSVPAILAFSITGLLKIKHGGKISIFSDKITDLILFLIEDFAYCKRIIRMKTFLCHLTQKFSDAICIFQHSLHAAHSIASICRIVLKRKLLLDIDDGINAEAAKTFLHPPSDILKYFFPYLRILPVEIRLLFMKKMKILFIGMSGKLLPHRTAEIASPVAWSPVVFFVFYIKEISVFSFRILNSFLKPFVFIGTMVHNKIHQDIHITFFCLCDQTIHIFHGSKPRINGIIICNIIPLVSKRGFINRRQPQNICTQLFQIIQFTDYSRDISDPVTIGIIKTLRVYLIYHFVMPPFFHALPPYACLIMQYCFRSKPFFCTIPYNLNPNFSYMATFAGLCVSREIISLCLSA